MARFDLTDFEWSVIQPILPNKPRGVPGVDDRSVLNGIFRRLCTGAASRRSLASPGRADIPARHGPHTMCVNPSTGGAKQEYGLFQAVSAAYDGSIQMIDSSSIRVHQQAAKGKKNGRSRCMGRSRGGLTTKVHALVDTNGLPIALKLTEGQAHDGRSAADMFETVQAGHILLADRAYDSDALRDMLRKRGARGNIRSMPNRKNCPAFPAWLCRQRNAVERLFTKIKHFRLSPHDMSWCPLAWCTAAGVVGVVGPPQPAPSTAPVNGAVAVMVRLAVCSGCEARIGRDRHHDHGQTAPERPH